jgi:hypothetical protein
MSLKTDDLVAEFLLSSIPARVLDVYKIVAQIKYPVYDKKSFSDQLDELAKQLKEPQDREASPIEQIRVAFDASDFPIQNPQSGLEKLHTKMSKPSRSDPPKPNLTYTDPGKFYDRLKGVDFDEEYRRTYGDCAGACASIHFYYQLRRNPYDIYGADRAGMAAGAQCATTGFCPKLPGSSGRPFIFGCLTSSPLTSFPDMPWWFVYRFRKSL